MNTQQLLESLRAQDSNLDLLMEALKAQKYAILRNDYSSLEEAISNEQKILKLVEKEESTRLKVIKQIADKYSIKLNENSLESLLGKARQHLGNELKDVEKVRESIKTKLTKITRTNAQLKNVVELSRSLIKETMMMFVGPNKRSLVNKRV